MTSKSTREENVQAVFDLKAGYTLGLADVEILKLVARMALAAMDSEPVYQVYGDVDDTWSDVDEEEMIRCRSIGEDTRTLYSAPQSPVVDSEPKRNPVLAYADSYRDMAKQGVESVPIWSVITDLERNIAPLCRHAQPAPLVPDNRAITQHFDTIALETAREILCDVNRRHELLGGDVQLLSRIQCRIDEACRAAMLQAAHAVRDLSTPVDPQVSECEQSVLQAGTFRENGNSSTNNFREIAETSTNRSREHFISLCNEFWSWQELDDITAGEEEPRLEWDGQAFTHRVTQALWRVYQAAPGNSTVIPDCWCRTCRPVTMGDMRFVVCPDCGNKRCPRANDHRNACSGSNEPGQEGSAYPAAPQEVDVSSALERGIERYNDALLKLANGVTDDPQEVK